MEEYGRAKIGERCERDRNCIQHSYCRVQMTCLCDQYYSPTLDRSMCVASEGLGCTDDWTCRTMANAECRQGKCTCKDTYLLDTKNSSNCISRPFKEGDRCQRNDDCQDALGHAMCINERCQCISNYHFANITGKCVLTRSLYHSCVVDYECKGSSNEDVLECRNSECVCKEGEAGCNKASLYSAIGIPVMLLLLLQRLI
ncbi:uncharacterized protein LOC143177279 [Calliopsis andreniformis]|uniref:uncharacterized protein LOC143177279 n=1 Tax=Calliopsis andreniformis TaxID=337506 RepID=UPI003FCD9F24